MSPTAAGDTDGNSAPNFDALLTLSRKASGTPHPAVFSSKLCVPPLTVRVMLSVPTPRKYLCRAWSRSTQGFDLDMLTATFDEVAEL